MKIKRLHNSQKGFTLLESLISLLMISIGILGIANMQLNGMRNNNSAYYRTQAVALTAEIADMIRANQVVATAGGYSSTVAMVDANATRDVDGWLAKVTAILPQGVGTITCTANCASIAEYTVSVSWDESLAKGVDTVTIGVIP